LHFIGGLDAKIPTSHKIQKNGQLLSLSSQIFATYLLFLYEYQDEANQPVVIDNGTGVLKAGFAGAERPHSYFPSAVGRPKHLHSNVIHVFGGKLEGCEYFVGDRVQEHRGILKISYPMEHGIVKNWEDMEKLWAHVYSKDCLGIKSQEHPVLLTEAPLNPFKNRERTAEIFFEDFNVPAMYCAPQAILSLYASGRTTGLVLDCGDGCTHVVPVYEGFALPHAIERADVAGRDVTDRLQLLLRRGGCSLQTSSERDIVRQIKEECCRVSFNPNNEDRTTTQEYRLPDGEVIQIGKEAYQAPEVLFQPELLGSEESGVHQLLV
jgi:centractin